MAPNGSGPIRIEPPLPSTNVDPYAIVTEASTLPANTSDRERHAGRGTDRHRRSAGEARARRGRPASERGRQGRHEQEQEVPGRRPAEVEIRTSRSRRAADDGLDDALEPVREPPVAQDVEVRATRHVVARAGRGHEHPHGLVRREREVMREDHGTPSGSVEDRPVVPRGRGRQGGHRLVGLHDAGHEHADVARTAARGRTSATRRRGRPRSSGSAARASSEASHETAPPTAPATAAIASGNTRPCHAARWIAIEPDDQRAELDRPLQLDQDRHEEHGDGVPGRDRGAGEHPGSEPASRTFGDAPARSEQQPGGDRRHREQRDADLDRRRAARRQVRQPELAEVEFPLEHDGDVVEGPEVQRPDPDRGRERVGRVDQEVRRRGMPRSPRRQRRRTRTGPRPSAYDQTGPRAGPPRCRGVTTGRPARARRPRSGSGRRGRRRPPAPRPWPAPSRSSP